MHIENGTGDRGMNGRILSSDYYHKQTNYGGKDGYGTNNSGQFILTTIGGKLVERDDSGLVLSLIHI